MKLHGNAALSWQGRRRLARRVTIEGWTLTAAAQAAGVSVRCARKWVGRYRLEGDKGLHDRSSAPKRVANRTPRERVEVVVALRRLRFTAAEIADALGMALSTVSGILARERMGRLGRLGLEQPVRYERSRPGELVHVDVKRLGRIEGGAGKRAFQSGRRMKHSARPIDAEGVRRYQVGYECVHVCVDDYSRLAYAEVLPDEKQQTAIGFLRRAVAFYWRHGIRVERVLTDNGSAYMSALHARACRSLGIRHLRTVPTVHKRTARQSASSARCSQAGRTGPSMAQARNVRLPLTVGSGTTTIAGDTQPSAANPRSAGPTCSGPTPRRSQEARAAVAARHACG
jgi:transposase